MSFALTADQFLTEAFHAHASFVWRSVRRLGVESADVDDAVQDVFIVAHRKWVSFEGRSSVKTWLFGICLKVVADYRKRHRRRREVVTDSVPEGHVEPTGPQAVQQRQARAALDRLLDTLDETKRATFILFEFEQLPMSDIAAMTGVPLQTAYTRLYAARRQLNAQLASTQEQCLHIAAPQPSLLGALVGGRLAAPA